MIYWVMGFVFGLCLLFVALSILSRKHPEIGIVEDRLKPCPERPNCVCSEEKGKPSSVSPFVFVGNSNSAWASLKQIIKESGGAIEEEKSGYLWATFRSRIFRFFDDLELRLDRKNSVIHVRSASRVGYSDLGLNRKRVETLKVRFNKMQKNF
jgi:uncharacterized protein (DUF1499 family)